MWSRPSLGDIVWCYFPQRPRDIPGPKPRPAWITEITDHEDGISVKVAYGTSQNVNSLQSGEFAIRKIDNQAAFDFSGLSYDTKFDLNQILELPWDDNFFGVPPNPRHGNSPLLGTVHVSLVNAIRAAYNAIK